MIKDSGHWRIYQFKMALIGCGNIYEWCMGEGGGAQVEWVLVSDNSFLCDSMKIIPDEVCVKTIPNQERLAANSRITFR